MTHHEDDNLEALPDESLPLAPSGASPWQHRVELINGTLVLYWFERGEVRLRTFSREETATLAEYLYSHKEEIFFPPGQEQPTP